MGPTPRCASVSAGFASDLMKYNVNCAPLPVMFLSCLPCSLRVCGYYCWMCGGAVSLLLFSL